MCLCLSVSLQEGSLENLVKKCILLVFVFSNELNAI